MYHGRVGRYELIFYEDARGICQVRDYLRAQSKKVRGHAGWLLQRLEEDGPNLIRPSAACLGDGIYELRIIAERRQHRILYFFDREFIVATNAFLKKSDRVPDAEIEKAKKTRAAWRGHRGK